MRPAIVALIAALFLIAPRLRASEGDLYAIVSVPDQKIAVIEDGHTIARFPVSTSRYGVGDAYNSFATPLGCMEIAGKIGEGAPLGAVFRHRHFTGEILHPNAQGRDPIVTRILQLRGLEACNAHAFQRDIYIHGTPVERLIGRPASYGCIRMRSRDIIAFFDMMPVGAIVKVSREPLPEAIADSGQPQRFMLAADDAECDGIEPFYRPQ
jgi:hypothetical protein